MKIKPSIALARAEYGSKIAGAKRAVERGSIIIEALVGAAILGVVAVSLCGAFSFGFATVRTNQEGIRADQIIVDRLETLEVYNWQELTGGTFITTNFTSYFTPPSGTNTVGSGTVYRGTIQVSTPPLTESYKDTLRQVTVSVAWKSGGVSRSRTMSTCISQYGIQAYKN
jgi:hypothetical protein